VDGPPNGPSTCVFHLAASVQQVVGVLTGKSKGNLGQEQNRRAAAMPRLKGFHAAPADCYRLSRAPLAQLVEQLTLNQRVRGSKP
jgi:hypothetical protein